MHLGMYSYLIHIHISWNSICKEAVKSKIFTYEQNDDTSKNHISIQYQIFVLRHLRLRTYQKVIKRH